MRALYAAENRKEGQPVTEQTIIQAGPGDDPDGAALEKCGEYEERHWYPATSFDELASMELAEEAVESVGEYTEQFRMIASNIMTNPDIENKGAALEGLAKEYAALVQGAMAMQMDKAKKPGLLQRAKELFTGKPATEESTEPTKDLGLFIWKEGDTYRWIAAYSNNRRDDDDPPEIISSDSHQDFDRALETKEWPMPEAWIWHVPYPVGITQYHAYDESTGFPVAAGVFYKGCEWAAEGLMKAGWSGVSHGMPRVEIERDESDPTVITRHRTKEISFLPTWAAANKLAFNIITKEQVMDEQKGLPAQKRKAFEEAFGAERVAEIEAALGEKAKEADAAGLEKKEAEAVPVEAETPAEPEVTEPALTREEVAEALNAAIEPVKELTGLVKELKAEVEALKAGKAAAEKETAETTPAFSTLAQMIWAQRAVGAAETRVDGRTELAKDAPEEAEPEPQFLWQKFQKINERQRAA